MEITIIICFTIVICFAIYCNYKKPKPSKILTPQDQCCHDMKIHLEFEDNWEKTVISVCTKCGFEREYNFEK
jgi:hypothetical protein